jgi:4-alpha-glucanotransferase
MAEQTIKEMLKMIDAKIEHIEDITADNRAVIIKLVKQSNQIVSFLKQIEVEDVTDEFDDITSPPLTESEKLRSSKMEELKELLDDFKDKHKDLKEFEKELEKNKDKLTPGTIGES